MLEGEYMIQMLEEIREQPFVLEKCIKNNTDKINILVDEIKKRKISSVFIAARGTSDHAAVYAKYAIEVMTGIPVALAAPSIITLYKKELFLKNYLVIGISQSGKAEDVLEVMNAGKKAGGLIAAITNSVESPMAHQSHIHLDCSAGAEKSVAATKTFSTQMMLAAILASKWASDNKIIEMLYKIPVLMSETLKLEDKIKDDASRFRFMEECFVIARGINYAVALETALKIQETTYVRAKAFAASDFYHGPFALLDRNIPVILFAPTGPSLLYIKELTQQLVKKDIDLIIISDNDEMLHYGKVQFKIPEIGNDILSPFLNIVTAQLFACMLAIEKGLNPDSPRDLKKITITR